MSYGNLIQILNSEVSNMCGVGTRYVKLYLNSMIKSGDVFASILRDLLECEMCNVNAKKYGWSYSDQYYRDKYFIIDRLLSTLISSNPHGISFGYEKSDVPPAHYIVYFYHPSFGQISFHCDISSSNLIFVNKYSGRWDGIVDSCLNKLEACIDSLYGDAIRSKYSNVVKDKNIKKCKQRVSIGRQYIFSSIISHGDYDSLLCLNDDMKSNIGLLQSVPKYCRVDLNKWLYGLVDASGELIEGCANMCEFVNSVRERISCNDSLSFLSTLFDGSGFEMRLYGITDDLLSMFESGFTLVQDVGWVYDIDFDGFDESLLRKLGLYCSLLKGNKKNAIRKSFGKYLARKYDIVIDYHGSDKPTPKDARHRISLENQRKKMMGVYFDEFVNCHEEIKKFGII